MFDLIQEGEAAGENRKNLVRACSEALLIATAKCYAPTKLWEGFGQSFYPRDETDGDVNTKLMLTVFTGGKAAASQVRFSKFYLIIDAVEYTKNEVSPSEQLPMHYMKFIAGMKKAFAGTK